MSLLDTASLIVTPNAGKEGKLYSVVPSNGDGDFTVTRATTATRVNSDGLIELVPYNILTYSEQFDNAIWLRGDSTIVSNNIASPNGVQDADKIIPNTNNTTHYVYQSVNPQITNTFSVYAKSSGYNFIYLGSGVTTTRVFFNLSNGTIGTSSGSNIVSSSITDVGNGWYRCSIVLSTIGIGTRTIAISNADGITSFSGNGTDGVYIWGAQLVEGTEAKDYLPTTTRLNIPRLDYSLGSCPNLLLEPQRTNLLLQSNDFSSSSWQKYAQGVGLLPIITPNYAVSPDGTLNASRVIFNANGTASADRSTIRQSTALTINTKYSTSIWVKSATGLPYTIEIYAVYGNTSLLQINVTNEWVRYEMPNIDSLTTTTGFTNIGIWNNSIKAINTIADVLIWGAQLEVGAYPTSYIPTTTASVTRILDSITRNNIYTNGLITASGGTWFVELDNNIERTRDASGGGIFLNTGTSSLLGNGFVIRNTGGGLLRLSVQKVINDIPISLRTTTTDKVKIAIKWNGSTADVFANGVKVVTATVFTATAMENLICNATNVSANINQMELFPTPLTDTQCIAITS
jgi:hypothetical protein